MADWIDGLLDSLGVASATLIGHSQGVLVALEAARRHPQRVAALGLIAGAMAIPVNDALIEMSQSAPAKAFRMMTSWGHGPGAHKFDNTQPGHAFLGYGRRVMAQNDDAALHADLVACNSYDGGEDAAAAVTQPSLCLIAGRDRMTPAKFGHRMAAAISAAHEHSCLTEPVISCQRNTRSRSMTRLPPSWRADHTTNSQTKRYLHDRQRIPAHRRHRCRHHGKRHRGADRQCRA